MDKTSVDYERLYSSTVKHIDKNLSHFIKQKEDKLRERHEEKENRDFE